MAETTKPPLNLTTADVQSFSNAYGSRSLLIFNDEPLLRYWMKSFTVPGISFGMQTIDHAPYLIKREDTSVTYNALSCEMFLDEYFLVYKQLYNWMMMSLPGPDYKTARRDGMIMILNNTMKEPLVVFNLSGMLPQGLNDLSYDNSSTQHLTMSLTVEVESFTPTFLR